MKLEIEVKGGIDVRLHSDEQGPVLQRLERIDTTLQHVLRQGARIMSILSDTEAKVDALSTNLDDTRDVLDQVLGVIQASDAEKLALRKQVADLIAASQLDDAAKATLLAKASAAFDKSDAVENKARALVPLVPPVGGEPLASTHASLDAFNAAVAAYNGPEGITLDGGSVRTGSLPAIDFYTHSADGSINTSGPTD